MSTKHLTKYLNCTSTLTHLWSHIVSQSIRCNLKSFSSQLLFKEYCVIFFFHILLTLGLLSHIMNDPFWVLSVRISFNIPWIMCQSPRWHLQLICFVWAIIQNSTSKSLAYLLEDEKKFTLLDYSTTYFRSTVVSFTLMLNNCVKFDGIVPTGGAV